MNAAALGPLRDICSGGKEPTEIIRNIVVEEDKAGNKIPTKPPYQMQAGDDTECSICLDPMDPGSTLAMHGTCAHVWHVMCLTEYIMQTMSADPPCPYCGRALDLL